jgi:hypothetical protein
MTEEQKSQKGVHDIGGEPSEQAIDRSEHRLSDWELKTDVLMKLMQEKRHIVVDENRRMIESLPKDMYEGLVYYERWAESIERLLIEKGMLTRAEIEAKVTELDARYEPEHP